MKTSEKGLEIIKKYEGLRLEAYRDPVGIPTIGYGHTSGVRMGQSITREQAEEFLKEDVVVAETAVFKYDKLYGWTQNQFDALVSFTYNCGAGNLEKLTAKGTRTKQVISEKMLTYIKAGGGKVLSGLLKRRQEEKALFDAKGGESAPTTEKWDTEAVRSLQEALNADGIRDKNGNALKVDGIKGSMTDSAVEKILIRAENLGVGTEGQLVKWLQMRLNTVFGDSILESMGAALVIDGKAGKSTRAAICMYQCSKNLVSDGIAGPKTVTELLKKV